MAPRPLRAIQVEVTSRCTRCCAICPRSELGDRWQEGDLSSETWCALRTDLGLAEHVHLQGWGEPLLHDELAAMVRDANAAGCRVGITTNGDLVADAAEWLVREHVDVLTLSLAGIGDWNERLRDGSDARGQLAAVAGVARLRGRRRARRLQVSVVLTRENAGGLPELVHAAAAHEIASVLINHLDCTPSAASAELSLWSSGAVPSAARSAVGAARGAARRCGIGIRLPALEPRPMLVCELDPRRVVSVRWDGRIGPCVYLNMPVDGQVPRCHPAVLLGGDRAARARVGERRGGEGPR